MKLDIQLFSGGSFDYLYYTIRDTYVGHMEDNELDDLMEDICDLLHDLEWYDSGDTSIEDYRKSIANFKNKWLKKKFGKTRPKINSERK